GLPSLGCQSRWGQAEARPKTLDRPGVDAHIVQGMSDFHSDPQSSPEPSRPVVESIPPAEPTTPAWLTWVGFVLLLVAIGWVATRCQASDTHGGDAPAANPAPAHDAPAAK
ncbi:MAG TPA: hypothetical protein VIV60_28265, partial [Polyangiaceae bacterium]